MTGFDWLWAALVDGVPTLLLLSGCIVWHRRKAAPPAETEPLSLTFARCGRAALKVAQSWDGVDDDLVQANRNLVSTYVMWSEIFLQAEELAEDRERPAPVATCIYCDKPAGANGEICGPGPCWEKQYRSIARASGWSPLPPRRNPIEIHTPDTPKSPRHPSRIGNG